MPGVSAVPFVRSRVTVLGLGARPATVVRAQTLIRLGAGLCLLRLGISMIRSSLSGGAASLAGISGERHQPESPGLLGSAFALTAPDRPDFWYHPAAVPALTLLSALWHSLLALLFATPALQRGYQGMKRQTDCLVGMVLALLGGGLPVPGRRML